MAIPRPIPRAPPGTRAPRECTSPGKVRLTSAEIRNPPIETDRTGRSAIHEEFGRSRSCSPMQAGASIEQVPAVDIQGLSGDVPCVIRYQKDDGVPYVRRGQWTR